MASSIRFAALLSKSRFVFLEHSFVIHQKLNFHHLGGGQAQGGGDRIPENVEHAYRFIPAVVAKGGQNQDRIELHRAQSRIGEQLGNQWRRNNHTGARVDFHPVAGRFWKQPAFKHSRLWQEMQIDLLFDPLTRFVEGNHRKRNGARHQGFVESSDGLFVQFMAAAAFPVGARHLQIALTNCYDKMIHLFGTYWF